MPICFYGFRQPKQTETMIHEMRIHKRYKGKCLLSSTTVFNINNNYQKCFLRTSRLRTGNGDVMLWQHRGFNWKPQTSLTKEKTPMKLASGFCIPEPLPVHTGLKGRQVHPLIRFYAEEPRRVPGNQRWFKIVAWGHNVSVPSIREQGLRT